MEKTKEVQEIAVLTPEQIDTLPETVKENVTFLTEALNPKDLATLNPIVEELLSIRKVVSKLELVVPEDGKSWDKENIQTYTDAKKQIRSFRATLKASGTKLKAPYLKIQKGIVAIEKAIKSEADDEFEKADAVFSDYNAYLEQRAKEREEAKNKALYDAVAESQQALNEAEQKLAKTSVFNTLRYDRIQRIEREVSSIIANGSEHKIKQELAIVMHITWEEMIEGLNISILDDNVLDDCRNAWEKIRVDSVAILNKAIESFSQVSDVNVVQPTNIEVTDKQLIDEILSKNKYFYNLVAKRLEEQPVSDPKLYDLRNLLSQFL